jgi:hypothetical protein
MPRIVISFLLWFEVNLLLINKLDNGFQEGKLSDFSEKAFPDFGAAKI